MRCKERFGTNLRRLLERDKVRGVALATTLGIKQSNVSRWVNGMQWPEAQYIDHMCEAFGWTLDELFTSNGEGAVKTLEPVSIREAVEVVLDELGFERTRLVRKQ